MPCNSNTPWLCWMLILSVISFHIDQIPAICFNPLNDISDLHLCYQLILSILFFIGAWLSFCESSNQFPAEVGNIFYNPPPDHISLAECGFVDPGRTSISQIIFDASGTGGFASPHNACGNGDPTTMANSRNNFALLIHITYKLKHLLVAPQFI